MGVCELLWEGAVEVELAVELLIGEADDAMAVDKVVSDVP